MYCHTGYLLPFLAMIASTARTMHTSIVCTTNNPVCKSKQVEHWPSQEVRGSKTAPTVLKATGCIHASTGIWMNWTQKASDLKNVKGYVIELPRLDPPGDPDYYVFNITTPRNGWAPGLVTFCFSCCPGWSDTQSRFLLNPLPLYKFGAKARLQPYEVNKPCADQKIALSNTSAPASTGQEGQKIALSNTSAPPPTSQDAARVVVESKTTLLQSEAHSTLATCFGILLLILLLTLVAMWRQVLRATTQRSLHDASSECMIIIRPPGESPPAVDKLMHMLQNLHGVEVVSNIGYNENIGKSGMLAWITDFVTGGVSTIMFLITEESDLDLIKDIHELACVVDTVGGNPLNKKGIIRLIAVDLSQMRSRGIPEFYEHYSLPEDLDVLLQSVRPEVQRHVSEEDKAKFVKMMNETPLPSLVSTDQNDFDKAVSLARADEQCTLNIHLP